uniref:Uncharacterized protein n=1 Tax=Anopheles melas TaxID=34690 RepID=A0A182UCX0_9DIPT
MCERTEALEKREITNNGEWLSKSVEFLDAPHVVPIIAHGLSVYRRADSLPSTIISITNNIIISIIIIIIIVIAKVRTALCAVTARKRFMLETLPIESERLICIYIERKRCNRMLNRTKRE